MKVAQASVTLTLLLTLAGCGMQVANSGRPVEVAQGSQASMSGGNAVERVISTIAVGHEISTSFQREKAAAAPAEMYPSF